MSGIIGHAMYAILGAEAAAHRRLPMAPIAQRHFTSYVAGSYLGCDIQTMPEAICVDTGRDVGYGTVPLEQSPLTGGAVRPYALTFQDVPYRPRQIHAMFYGRSHLVFGWPKDEQAKALSWERLPDYLALVVEDSYELFGPSERQLAYLFGWMTHVVGDSLIKSVRPGITLHLLDGKYTPKNRPIQDLLTFHEIGRKALGLDWRALLTEVAGTPVEPVQAHYMRVAPPHGRLAAQFPDAWRADQHDLLMAVLAENRRYLRIYNEYLLTELELKPAPGGCQCSDTLRQQSGGLTYAEMVQLAEREHFRDALRQIAEAIADLFAQVVERSPLLQRLRRTSETDGKDLIPRRLCRRSDYSELQANGFC